MVNRDVDGQASKVPAAKRWGNAKQKSIALAYNATKQDQRWTVCLKEKHSSKNAAQAKSIHAQQSHIRRSVEPHSPLRKFDVLKELY